jgi:hypothetical protein
MIEFFFYEIPYYAILVQPSVKYNDGFGFYVSMLVIRKDLLPLENDFGLDREVYLYLHNDGKWRESTLFRDAYSGYYRTDVGADKMMYLAVDRG